MTANVSSVFILTAKTLPNTPCSQMEPLNLKGKQRAPDNDDDGFFMERLEMLYEQGLGDLRAFSERENRPFEEVRFSRGT